jgi:hypothetical protein
MKLQQIYLKQGQTHTQKYEVVTGKHTNLTTVKILLAHFLKQDQEKKKHFEKIIDENSFKIQALFVLFVTLK